MGKRGVVVRDGMVARGEERDPALVEAHSLFDDAFCGVLPGASDRTLQLLAVS